VVSTDKNDSGWANHLEHKITTKDERTFLQKATPDYKAHRDDLEKQIKNWLAMGLIQPSRSHYNSLLFMVPRKDGSMRVFQDFKELNVNSLDDRYSMKDIKNVLGTIVDQGLPSSPP
jgi:hypothetical protein